MADITPNTANPVREDAYVTELATKLGIDAKYIPKSPTWRNEEEIKVLADLFANMSAGGDSGLPDTPGTDGTYALQNTVESGTGTLSWASGGGGGGAMLVPLTLHPNMQNLISSKSFQEIKEAYSGGQPVIFAYDDDNLYFSLLEINSNGSLLYIYYIKPSDSSIIEVHGSATSSPLFPYQSL